MLVVYKQYPGVDAGLFTGGGWKFCIHTTQGTSISGAHSTLNKNRNHPHVMISPREKGRPCYQYLPFNRAAKALANNNADGYATNRSNVIQMEIVGLKDTAWTDDEYKFIAEQILACQQECQKVNGGTFSLDYPSFAKPSRFTDQKFVAFTGIHGHMHVPDNDHSDPGSTFDIAKVTNYMKGPSMSADALTEYETKELYKAYFGVKNPPAYDFKHVGRPVGELIAQFRKHDQALMNQESLGLIGPVDTSALDKQKDELYEAQTAATKKVFGK